MIAVDPNINVQKGIYLILMVITFILASASYFFFRQAEVIYSQAEAKNKQEHYQEALDLYRQSIQKGYKEPKVYLNIADAYTALGDFEESVKWYRMYLEKKPKDSLARLKLARVLSYVGHYDESLKEYRKALEDADETNNHIIP